MSNGNSNFKKVKFVINSQQKQWVGDGFFVHGLIRPTEELVDSISPFLLLDYASPFNFSPTVEKRGVGEHPHRGFETVTLAYQGGIEHRDSSGGGGVIQPGDVQWMTAGSGVVHDEFHSEELSKNGGLFEMVQLWVNLPAKNKMTAPNYQGIESSEIPVAKLDESTQLRVISGQFNELSGPAQTFSPISMYDISSEAGGDISLKLKAGANTILLVLRGKAKIENSTYSECTALVFEQDGEYLDLKLFPDFKGLVLSGDPIREPVVAHGPFVMNTRKEISEAIRDYQAGKMGKL